MNCTWQNIIIYKVMYVVFTTFASFCYQRLLTGHFPCIKLQFVIRLGRMTSPSQKISRCHCDQLIGLGISGIQLPFPGQLCCFFQYFKQVVIVVFKVRLVIEDIHGVKLAYQGRIFRTGTKWTQIRLDRHKTILKTKIQNGKYFIRFTFKILCQ